MTRPSAAAVLTLALGAAGAAAQTPPAAAPAPPSSTATVTLTGCLQKGERTGMYVLTHVAQKRNPPGTDEGAQDAKEREGDASQPAAASGAPGADTVRLAGLTERLMLNDYVGSTVAVTGVFAREDRTVTPGVLLPGTEPAGRPAVGEGRPARIFTVSRVRQVAAGCGKQRGNRE